MNGQATLELRPQVVLGVDPSKTKVGWGMVNAASGAALRCGSRELDGSPEAVRRFWLDVGRIVRQHDLVPVFALVEYPFGGRGSKGIFESGVAVGMHELAMRMQWPGLTIDRIDSQRWRSLAGVPRAPKELPARSTERRNWLKVADCDRATELGFRLPTRGVQVIRPDDDAADGALIAYAAWKQLEAGAARRVA